MSKRIFARGLVVSLLALAGLGLGGSMLSRPVAAGSPAAPAAGEFPGTFFVHTHVNGTTGTGYRTFLDYPLLDDDPSAVFLATHNASVHPGPTDTLYPYESGVNYYLDIGPWVIYNLVNADTPTGVSFNVYVPPVSTAAFIHTNTVANGANYTVINNANLNDDSQALAFVTYCHCVNNLGGNEYDHTLGVWYNGSEWTIFTQDQGHEMEINRRFKVFATQPSANAFTHKATAANIITNVTLLNHPLARGRPDAVVVVTQNLSPFGSGGQYNDHPIGVRYITAANTWAIFNEDSFDMPVGAAFNVLIDGQAVFVPMVQR